MKKKEKNNNTFLIFTVFILFIALLFVLAKYYYPRKIIVKENAIKNSKLNEKINGLKIIQISDIHYKSTILKSDLARISKEVNKYKPDIILFTGDLFLQDVKYSENDLQDLQNFLTSLDAKINKYAINGEDDDNNNFESILSNSGFKVLNNEKDFIYYETNNPIEITGINTLNPNYEINNEENNNLKIVLLHKPDDIKKLNLDNVDIVFSGHSHGGQIRLPFIGSVYNFKGSRLYYNDYYKINNTDLYISSGLGTKEYYYRFLNKPAINLYRVYNN